MNVGELNSSQSMWRQADGGIVLYPWAKEPCPVLKACDPWVRNVFMGTVFPGSQAAHFYFYHTIGSSCQRKEIHYPHAPACDLISKPFSHKESSSCVLNVKSEWLRHFVLQQDDKHESGNRATNIGLQSRVWSRKYNESFHKITFMCKRVCLLVAQILVWIWMEKSNGLESGLRPQTSLGPNLSSRVCQLLWLRVRDVTSLGLGFHMGGKENITKLMWILNRGLSCAPG